MFNLIWTIFICIKIRTECQVKVISGIHMYPKCGKNWSLALLFFQSFDCYFFILDDYTCKICLWCFYFDHSNRLTSDIQDFKSSFKLCISQGLRAVTQVSGYISPFPVLSIFLCVQCSIYRLLFRQIVLHLTLNMFTCVINSLIEERRRFLCDNYLCDKACIYNLRFKTNSL